MELILYERDLKDSYKHYIEKSKTKCICPVNILKEKYDKTKSKLNISGYCKEHDWCPDCHNNWHKNIIVIKEKKGNIGEFK